jgi:hypothetical protein
MSDDAQWIVLMGFLVSLSLFFLALLITQSTLVGQTTAEGVVEFPKNDIRDVREIVLTIAKEGDDAGFHEDLRNLSLNRKNAMVSYEITAGVPQTVRINFNNGITIYRETTCE